MKEAKGKKKERIANKNCEKQNKTKRVNTGKWRKQSIRRYLLGATLANGSKVSERKKNKIQLTHTHAAK